MPRTRLLLRLAFVLLCGLISAWRSPVQAQAPEVPAPGSFAIRVYACERDPGSVGIAMGTDPAECVRVDGVTVHVAAPDGRPIASCVTGHAYPIAGECAVSIPSDLRVVVTQDTATLPTGYLPRQNPIFTINYTEFASAIFVNLPADQITPNPTVAATSTPEVAPTRPPEFTASLTIHNRVCPLEFQGSDFYGVCHDDPIAGMPFSVRGDVPADAVTDAAGNITFAALPPGRSVVSGGPPGDFVRNAIFCARADRPGIRYPLTRLSNGDDLICDWFSVPEYRGTGPTPTPDPTWIQPAASGESITIHGKTCPAGDIVADCPGVPTVDARYRLEHLATGAQLPAAGDNGLAANAAGTVAFDLAGLGPGPIRVSGASPAFGSGAPSLILCTAADGSLVRPSYRTQTTPGGISFEVRLDPGNRAHCVIRDR